MPGIAQVVMSQFLRLPTFQPWKVPLDLLIARDCFTNRDLRSGFMHRCPRIIKRRDWNMSFNRKRAALACTFCRSR